MMNYLSRKIKGVCRVKVCGVFPETVLNSCAAEGVELWQVESAEAYSLSFFIYEAELEKVRCISERCMCTLEELGTEGGSKSRGFLKRHAWFFGFSALVWALLAISSLFIWDIKIYGCEELSRGELLRALSECGVRCGTYWPSVKTDAVRSEMLLSVPELAWMTVNVNGSRATVLVSERVEKPEIYLESEGADIVAKQTGIVRRVSVLSGRGLIEPGRSVVKGETLVTGRLESLSRGTRLVRSQAEVIADTWHEISAACPLELPVKTQIGPPRRRFALKFGGRRINLYFGGRKNVDESEKSVHNYILGMEGVFALPIALIVEEYRPYESEAQRIAEGDAMGGRLLEALKTEIDGDVLSHSAVSAESGGLLTVTLRAHCRENIGFLKEYTPAR